jgi:hypothetical protein
MGESYEHDGSRINLVNQMMGQINNRLFDDEFKSQYCRIVGETEVPFYSIRFKNMACVFPDMHDMWKSHFFYFVINEEAE